MHLNSADILLQVSDHYGDEEGSILWNTNNTPFLNMKGKPCFLSTLSKMLSSLGLFLILINGNTVLAYDSIPLALDEHFDEGKQRGEKCQ